MKKKYWIWISLFIGFILSSQLVLATGQGQETEVGVSFNQSMKGDDPTTPPVIYKPIPPNSVEPNGKLPQLGQLVSSLICLLGGMACLIIVIGAFSFKKIYLVDG